MSEPLLSGDELKMLESLYGRIETRDSKTIRVLIAEIYRARRERNQLRDALGRELSALEKRAQVNGE